MTWWPVTILMLLAPLGAWGVSWLDKQRLQVAHFREVGEIRSEAIRQRDAAYARGKREGADEVRDAARLELDKTREALTHMEAELEAERAKIALAPSEAAKPEPSAEVRALCNRSASCRERAR